MKAAVFYSPGGPEVFRYEDVADPHVADDQVELLLCNVAGQRHGVEPISIEGGDTLARAGGELFAVPHIVGYQCAGTVVDTGAKVVGLSVGDRVVTVGLDGSHAALRAAPEGFCWKIPEGLSTDEAACIPVAYGTAHDCLFEFGHLEAGESILVQAGASGVGIAAIQMVFGLDEGINYATADMVAEARRLTGGQGVNLVLESVGGPNLQASLNCLAYRGRCVSIGDAGRSGTTLVDTSVMRPNSLTLSGYFLGMELFTGTRAYATIAAIIDDVAAGRIRVVIDRKFPLSEAAAAHAYLESRAAFGRVLLIP